MKTILLLISLISLIFFTSTNFKTKKIYQFRGENRHGIYEEKNLKKTWNENEPQLLWFNDSIGNGYGSPVIASDNLYIIGEIDSSAILFCFDLDGKKVWNTVLGKEWTPQFPGSRCAPTIVDDLLYVSSGLGNLYCVDIKSGKTKWSVDKTKDLNGLHSLHGHAEAPLIDEDLVFFVPGGKDTNVVALNRFTGNIQWICKGMGEKAAYNSPNIFSHHGRKILIAFSSYHFMGIDANTGKLLWSHEQDNVPLDQRGPGYGDTHSNTAYYENGFIYYIAGDGNGAVKFELSDDGNSIKLVWRNQDIDNYMGGFVKIDNYIYTCRTERKDIESIDVNTGELVDSLKLGSGAIISADQMLYYYNQKGEVHLLKYQEGKMSAISSFKVKKGTREHFAHPVIDKGILYIRHGKALMAYDIKE